MVLVYVVSGQKLELLYEEFGANVETEYTIAAAHGYVRFNLIPFPIVIQSRFHDNLLI